jgi:hypothetical protein
MPFQFDENGLQIRQLSENLAKWEEIATRLFGAGAQVSQETQSNLSKMLAEFADLDTTLEEGIEGIYLSQYRSTAGGVSLDRVGEITGSVRQAGSFSTLFNTMYAAGVPATVIGLELLQMSVLQSGDLFINSAEFTLGAIGDTSADSITRAGTTVTVTISATHSYPLNSWVFIEGVDQSEYNVLAQITAITSTTFDYEISGTLPASPATGTFLVREATPFSARSIEEGAIQALPGSLTVIEVTPESGLNRVENSESAVLGNVDELDPAFRQRQTDELGALGGGTPEAIKAIVLKVPGVTSVTVFQNVTFFTDANGLPGKAVEVLVEGGADQDIFDALTGTATQPGAVSAGIQQHGSVTGTATDSSGSIQPSAFSRLTSVRIYVDIVVTTNSDPLQGPVFPLDGEAQILDNLSSIVFAGGGDVWKATITNAVTSVNGVVTVVPKFGKTVSPSTDTTVVILRTEKADIATGDITGTIDGVPI